MGTAKKIGGAEILLLCGVIGPLLFIVVLLIEGATRPGYSAWQTDGSYLALSNQGWEQIANFLVSGLLCIAFAFGLRRAWRAGRGSVWGPLLIGLFGLGLVLAGVFVTDPGGGYPPGAPINGSPQTLHGWIHGINGALLFNVVLPAACFVVSRRFASEPQNRGWATYSWVTGALILVISVVSTITLPIAEKAGFSVIDGLIQRVLICMGWIWVALVALHVWRQERGAISDQVASRSTVN
ncbi:MAG TPA: DUF998 domain-containing protein [Ktedonobacteraceae bacterium]|nr:DUF998 domain-containing protein [Ktedonobacteraceae bacterium]